MKKAILAIALLLISLSGTIVADPKADNKLLIRGGWLFDSVSAERRVNSGILIENGVITALDLPDTRVHSQDTKIVELSDDQTVLPGLVDLHAHYGFDFLDEGRVEEAAYNGIVYLANGVTSTWSAGEFNPERIIAQRNLIESGEAVGPRLLSSGPYFGGFRCEYKVKVAADNCVAWPNDITDQEIRNEVDYWAGNGITSVKIKQATPHEMSIIIDQAKKHGLTTTGHLANYNIEFDVSTQQAIKLGIDRIEHQLLLALNPEEADQEELDTAVKLMIDHQVFYDANLQMYGSVNLRDKHLEEMVWTNEGQYFTPYAQKLLLQRGPPPPESDWPEYRQRLIELMALYNSGGENLLVVGTDEPVYTLLLPGFAYHRELLALTYAGLPNHIVLKAATLNGATALGLGDMLGSLEVNKLADLIIVNGNPLADIKHTRNIHRVIKQGVVHNPKTLLKSAEGKIGPKDENDHAQWILKIPPLRTAAK